MQLDEISYRTDGAVATITLDRPDKLNAISARPGGMRDQILHAVAAAEGDPAIGCIVVRGAGGSFCGGGDLTGNVPRETTAEHHEFLAATDSFHRRVSASRRPTIAAVHGHCLGAGVLLASACDLVVAASSATFGFPEGRLGLVGAAVLTPVIGRQWAKYLMLTGESVDADRARRIGLVLSVEPDDHLFGRVDDLAARIARMPREATLLNRRAIDGVWEATGGDAARGTAVELDALTLAVSGRASAPDGRTFRSIITEEGMEGLKRARAQQYTDPWLG